MTSLVSASSILPLLLVALPAFAAAQSSAALDSAFELYWTAASPGGEEAAVAAILASGAPFDSMRARLRGGRPYSSNVATGRLDFSHRIADGLEHQYYVVIPADYDPERRYGVRFFLHGGVQRPRWNAGGEWWRNPGRVTGSGWISVFPSSWNESLWWQASQVENLAAILENLKRRYNVDENRVHLLGFSDGGAGVFFQAFRSTTPWAGYLSFISNPAVLSNPDLSVDGQMHVLNVTNKPLFVVTGGLDRLYPTHEVSPFLEVFDRAGAEIVFRPQPNAGHDIDWWPAEAARIDSFIEHTPRAPLPDRIMWETERTDRYNRAHWLLITELGPARSESAIDDFNSVDTPPSLGIVPGEVDELGVRVLVVDSGSVAALAGLAEGDLIVNVGGSQTQTVDQLALALLNGTYGSTISIEFLRGDSLVSSSLRFPTEAQSKSQVFPRPFDSGRVCLEREDNTITVRTTGVLGLKLLISPSQFDLNSPLVVRLNGRETFNGKVTPDINTMLRWALRDNDRTMLFAAEIDVELDPARR